jgi:hypothetical protein
VAGPEAVGRIAWEVDPVIERMVGGWPNEIPGAFTYRLWPSRGIRGCRPVMRPTAKSRRQSRAGAVPSSPTSVNAQTRAADRPSIGPVATTTYCLPSSS